MSFQQDNYEDERVTLPRRNMEWVEAIVKWTRYDYVAMYDYPTIEDHDIVMEIYTGDMLHVSKRYRREDWCLCQIGHVIGWVYLKDVRFIFRSPARTADRPEQQQVHVSPPREQQLDMSVPSLNIKHNVEETETEPAKPAVASAGAASKKSMVNKLINFFKR